MCACVRCCPRYAAIIRELTVCEFVCHFSFKFILFDSISSRKLNSLRCRAQSDARQSVLIWKREPIHIRHFRSCFANSMRSSQLCQSKSKYNGDMLSTTRVHREFFFSLFLSLSFFSRSLCHKKRRGAHTVIFQSTYAFLWHRN